MKEVKNKEYAYTPYLSELHTFWSNLFDNMDKVFNQNFYQHRVSMNDKIEYLKAVSKAESNFWSAIAKEYPELTGKSVNANHFRIKEN